MATSKKVCDTLFYRTTRVKNKFVIPWKNYGRPSRLEAFKWVMNRKSFEFPTENQIKQHHLLNPNMINKNSSMQMVSTNENQLKYTWITHATTLVSFDNFTVLTDPFFSGVVGPLFVRFLAKFDNCRSHGILPISIEDLPHIDAVVISHDHFDHLDEQSVKQLYEKFGDNLTWFTPLNYKSWFKSFGIENVVELEWWQEAVYKKSTKSVISLSHIPIPSKTLNETIKISPDDNDTLVLSLCPSQHWCSRNMFVMDHRLWGSWVVRNSKFKFFFAGDTGYANVFKSIGQRYGSFDLSAIPIGAYKPSYMMKNEHLSPTEAIQVHQDINSKKSIGVHWGAFHFCDEGFFEAPLELERVLKETKLSDGEFSPVQIGVTNSIEK